MMHGQNVLSVKNEGQVKGTSSVISRRRGKARIAGKLPLCRLISTTSFSSFSSLISLREVDSVNPALASLNRVKRKRSTYVVLPSLYIAESISKLYTSANSFL